jgi:hypothetical protein
MEQGGVRHLPPADRCSRRASALAARYADALSSRRGLERPLPLAEEGGLGRAQGEVGGDRDVPPVTGAWRSTPESQGAEREFDEPGELERSGERCSGSRPRRSSWRQRAAAPQEKLPAASRPRRGARVGAGEGGRRATGAAAGGGRGLAAAAGRAYMS